MKKSRQIILNLFVLILMLLNPLSSFASTTVRAQSISDAKSVATVDITAGKIWEGGPDEKPELWFMLMREGAGGLEKVPGILPKQITATQRTVSWFGLPKYDADGVEISYKVREGIWNPIEEKFEQGIPEGYRAVYSLDELTIRNIFIEDEVQPPVETPPPAFEPIIKEIETPVPPAVPTEEPTDPVEEPIDPTEEPTTDPLEPIELPVITPEPYKPPVVEPRLINFVTAIVSWQGGELPRPAFWLKLQKIDSSGNVVDVPDTVIIQANLATRVTWANIADFGQVSDYTVAVVDSTGAPYILPGYITTIDGLRVTFTYEEQNTIDVIANVEWLASLEPKEAIDFEQYPDYKVPSVYLRLYRQVNENEVPVALLSTELIQLADAASTASWPGLPAGSTNGTQYIYSVKQVDADGKDFIPEGFQKIEDSLLVQNVLIPGSGDLMPNNLNPPVPTHTYIFNNGATVFATQYVRNGETLLDPGNPGGDGFTGWYDIDDNLQTLPRENVVVTENQTIHYYAHFDDFVYVRFYDTQVDPLMVIKTKQIPNGAVTDGTGVPLIPGPGKALDYWSTAIGGTPFDFTQPITSDTDLYAVLKDAWKVTFASRGGSSVLPQYVSAGDTATPPTAPSRMGYTFYRWTTDEAGTNPYDFSTPVTADLTLYAQWTPANANYVVVYWQENAEDDGYTFFEIEEKTGPSGSPATYTPKSYTGFHFSHRDEKTIAGNGSTVENVYYKRNVWTLKIEYQPRYSTTWYTFSTTPLKYGQSTATQYNAAVAAYPNHNWYVSRTSSTAYSEAPAMPNANLTISGRYAGSTRWTIRYWEKNTTNPVKPDYVFFAGSGSLNLTIEDGIYIPGFTVTPMSEWINFTNRVATIFYTRNNYDITFLHNNPVSGPGTWLARPYQSNISTAPTHSGLTAGTTKVLNGVTYTFTGNWFENPACQGTAYNFTGATMPAHNLVFYAEWTPETYNFTAYDPEGNVVPGTPINVLPGGTVDPASLPTGFTWYWYVGGFFVPYDFSRPIYEDVEVYAIRTVALTYQVSYDANGGFGAPVDSNHYESGVQAVVLDAPSVAPAATPAFLGWSLNSDGSGPRYQPHDKITVNGNITLYAIWGPVPQKTKVTYKPGVGGTGADQTFENLIINGTITLIDNPFTPIEDYTFIGWKNATDGLIYQPGDVLQVDANAEGTNNILTAQWTRRIVAQKIWSGGSDPRPDVWFRLYRKVGTTGIGEPVPGLSPNPVQLPQPTGTSASVEWTGLLATNSTDEPYIYYVEEVDADGNPATTPGYRMTIGEDGLTITNTFLGSPDPTNITSLRFEKTWMPNPLPAGVTPPQIKVKVWGNGALYRTATLTYPDTVVEWKNLPLYDENGTPITYTITEEPIQDFAEGSPVYTESVMENVYCTQEQNQSAWPLQNPSFVIIRTTGNGPFVIWTLNHLDPADRNTFIANAIAAGPNEQPLKALSSWTGDIIWLEGSNVSYDVLPNDPNSGLITINAVFNPDGTTYTTTLNFQGTNTWSSFAVGTYSSKLAKITNTYIAANKIWVYGKAPRPTVWFKLYRQIGTGTPEPVPGASIKELPSGTTKVTWDGETIATTNAAGEPYIFSVREVDAAGNDFTPPNYTKSENGMTVTNTYQIPGNGTATATKKWSGGPTPRPTVWFKLYRNIEGGTVEEVLGAAILPLPNGTTSVTWTGLAKTDIDGNVYTFSVKEVDADGNDFTPANYTKSGEGTLEITNTYVPPTNGTAEATKEWVGGPTPRPTVWFKLYRKIAGGDLEEVPETEAPIKALVDGVLSVTWNSLTETDNNGNLYTFSVKEGLMAGDPAVWQEGPPANYTKAENGLNVTNTYVSPIITVPSFKAWYPPALVNKFPVTFQLWRYYEGEASSTAVMVQPAMTVVLDGIADSPCTGVCGYENDAWQVLWLGIPATDSAGRTYKYVVKEILPSPLPAGFTQSGELMDTITNSYQSPTDNLTATKVWEPAGLTEDLKVPVTFQLYRSCEDPNALYPVEPIEPAVTVSAPDWNHTWDDMPKTNPNGYPYTYWVKEVGETDGTIVLDGNTFAVIYDQENLKVTNTYVSPTAGQTGTKEWAPPDLLDEYKVTVWFQLWRYIGSDPAAAVKVGDPVAITAPWTYTWAMPTHDGMPTLTM